MYQNNVLVDLIDALRKQYKDEQPWLEFKTSFIDDYKLGHYISALSNGAALSGYPYGYLIFGVHDKSHEIVGTKFTIHKKHIDEKNIETSEDLEGWLNHMVSPRIRFDFHDVDYGGRKVVLVEIQSANWQPTEFMNESYFRVGSYVKKLREFPQRSAELWEALNTLSFEDKMCRNQELHFDQLEKYAKKKKVSFSKDEFITYGFVDRHGFYTNLAQLFSDENDIQVKFAVYGNLGRGDFRVKKEFTGSWAVILDEVLEQANLFNHLAVIGIGKDGRRIERADYPEIALREMICNAFCHLDLAAPSEIKLEFFMDHFEIANPGPLYKNSLEEALKGRQSFRNKMLVGFLSHLEFIENYATGFKKTREAYKQFDIKPEYVDSEHFFTVLLPNVNYGVEDNVPNNVPNKSDEEIIIELIRANCNVTRKEMAKAIGKSEKTVQRIINTSEKIIRIGSSFGGHWEIKE